MNDLITIIPGDPGYMGACITSATRESPRHIWLRAATHCFNFRDLPFMDRLATAVICNRTAEGLSLAKYKSSVKWGWGKGYPGQR